MWPGAEAGRVRLYGRIFDGVQRAALAAGERLDLKLCTSDKKLLAQGVAIEGLSLAALVRLAARQRSGVPWSGVTREDQPRRSRG
jgi:hypothetical protein